MPCPHGAPTRCPKVPRPYGCCHGVPRGAPSPGAAAPLAAPPARGAVTPALSPQYATLGVVLSLLAAAAFLQLSSAGKLLLGAALGGAYLALAEGPHAALFDNADLLLLAHAL